MEEDKDSEHKEIIPGYRTTQEFSADGFKRVVNAVKTFQALPQAGPSWDLHKSYPEFSKSMKNARSKMVPMMVSLLKHVNIPTSEFKSRDIDEKFDFLVDSNDELLERIGTSLDDAEGIFKKGNISIVDKAIASTALKPPGTWGKRKLDSINAASIDDNSTSPNSQPSLSNRQTKKAVYRTRVIEKPQLKFAKPIDNSSSAFVPKLKEKPHSLKPLSILPEYNSKNEEFYGHPYTVELNRWVPRDEMLTRVNPTLPTPLKDTPVVYVSTISQLEGLMRDLMNVTEIAVDLEHHSFRTYLGLTCTIQISSRNKDYVIDGFTLREELYNLNEIFADPKILKVFHGASNDIDWLQRDFGIYVVNMFDTYVAARALGLPQHSLQYLLGKYCEVSQNKSLQLADWRMRPLTDEMLEYARQDTHFLLYISECMKNELIDAGNQHNNLLISVFDQSRLVCLKRYEKPVCNAQLALRKTRRSLNNRQLYAFTEIYKWRDETAREKDESIGYVLPQHMLLTIAESLPKEMNGILACCDPVPPLIHSNLGKLHKIITTARELPLHQQSVQKDKVEKKTKLKNWMIVVNSIHDVAPIENSELTSESEDAHLFEEKSTLDSSESAASGVWPQPWKEPEGWRKYLNTTKKPLMRFNQTRVPARPIKAEKSSQSSLLEGSSVSALTTPYGRYQVSKKIVEVMKDPEKQKDLDLTDPLVKTVVEAVMLVDESDVAKDSEADLAPAELSKVLDQGEFIPFNPMGEPAPKRRKKNKHESWDDGAKSSKDGDKFEVINVEDDNDEGVEYASRSDSGSVLKSKSKKTRRNRSGGKLLNRIKSAFHKDKRVSAEDPEEGEIEEDGDDEIEVIQDDPPPRRERGRSASNPSPPSNKKMKHDRSRKSQHHEQFNNKSFRDNDSDSVNSRRNQGKAKNFQRDKNKNKTGIFKAFKRNERSITFK